MKTVLSAIDIAKLLKIPVLNMHMSNGVYFTLPNETVFLFNQYMHVHDAKGSRNHLPLGTGKINISERLSLAREHNCRIVLENKDH